MFILITYTVVNIHKNLINTRTVNEPVNKNNKNCSTIVIEAVDNIDGNIIANNKEN